jgi:hypothetical protein
MNNTNKPIEPEPIKVHIARSALQKHDKQKGIP